MFSWVFVSLILLVRSSHAEEDLQSMYMRVPLVSFPEALRRVPNLYDQSGVCIDAIWYKSMARNVLSRDEAAAVRMYTANCHIYRLLNVALRSGQLSEIRPWFSYLKLFHTALDKLKEKRHSFCRGENIDSSQSLSEGSIVTWHAVTSLSSQIDACVKFLNTTDQHNSGGVIYWVKSSSAQTVREYSEFPLEDEFILLPGTKLKLIRKSPNSKYPRVTEAFMEEVTPTPPTPAPLLNKPTSSSAETSDSSDHCRRTLIITVASITGIIVVLNVLTAGGLYFYTKHKKNDESI